MMQESPASWGHMAQAEVSSAGCSGGKKRDRDGGNVEALRSAVAKLRRKLGDDARKPRYVIGVRGLGYRMPEPDTA
ncbi:MAG: winged helix-turn-helix domain-containing protein [Chloroflexi bacterium]|nr:winged helix-turn-helix domain-containing protein [Chloroflexota bacterium]